MTQAFIRTLKRKAHHLTFNNIIYNWSLGGSIPESMLFTPKDNWPGCPEKGLSLCEGLWAVQDNQLAMRDDCWDEEDFDSDTAWRRHKHSFDWLRNLRALGGDNARYLAHEKIMSWIDVHHRWDAFSWQPGLTGKRLCNWIGLYDFYAAGLDVDDLDDYFDAIARQLRHLSRTLPGNTDGIDLLYAIKGLAYGGLVFKGREYWLEQALDLLEDETTAQILPDGGHVSRSPQALLETIQIFIDIRAALLMGGYPIPEQIEHTIDRMAQALRFFRYADKGLAIFHGAQEGDCTLIDALLKRANARGRTLKHLPQSGYRRATLGRSVIMMDAGLPPHYPHDKTAHASPLAFEFTYGRERIFVSCGTHPTDDRWSDLLRSTAAHTTLGINDRNVCEIRDSGHFGRTPRAVVVNEETAHDAILLEGTHDGYMPMNGMTHRRRIFMTRQGHDIRGEENMTAAVSLTKPTMLAARFHLHPRVSVSMIQDGHEALLRLPGGSGWRFNHAGGGLMIEDSIYLGEGDRPRKTKQLVIYGEMKHDQAQIKWALQRENR